MKQYFIGGFTWGKESQLERFVKDGVWENGYEEEKYADLFKQIKIGDYFALKSTFVKNNQSWLKIAKIGCVSQILNEHALAIKWLDIPMFEITDIRWYANTLEKIVDKEHVEKIFGQAIKTNHMNKEIELSKSCKNLILTGAPGTGKTYKTAEIAVAICDGKIPNNRSELMKRYKELEKAKQIAFTTFHQSIDYEEFVEGLKPDIDETTEQGNGSYSVRAGIFKEICDRAKEKQSMASLDAAIEKFKVECSNKIIKVKNRSGGEFSVAYRGGKTFRVRSDKSETDEGRDFPTNIEMIKKLYQGIKDGIYNETYLWGILNYLKTTYKISDYEKDNSDKKYVLIIDEINRGNISKIFGELITLLEKDKRLGEKNEITATLPYSQKTFGVPSNLYIIGTMNTADRSIGHIDYAIRRRFAFISIKADKNVITNYSQYQGNTKQKAEYLFDDIKKFVEENINTDLDAEDLMIGHSYFLCKTAEDLKMRLEYEIIPLIEEYEKDGIIMVEKDKLKAKFEEWKMI